MSSRLSPHRGPGTRRAPKSSVRVATAAARHEPRERQTRRLGDEADSFASAGARGARRSGCALTEAALTERIRRIEERHRLVGLGVGIYDYQTGLEWSYRSERTFHAASTMKLAVLLGLFRQIDQGTLTLDTRIPVTGSFKSFHDGSEFELPLSAKAEPDLHRFAGGTATLRDLAYAMITTSSNVATNLLIEKVGVGSIEEALAAAQVDGVRVLRGVGDEVAFAAGKNNQTTAGGMRGLLRAIAEGRGVSEASRREMAQIMLDQQYRSGIPAGLPPSARVAHKTGNVSGIFHDAGIVHLPGRAPYVLTVLTQFAPNGRRGSAIAEVSREVLSFLQQRAETLGVPGREVAPPPQQALSPLRHPRFRELTSLQLIAGAHPALLGARPERPDPGVADVQRALIRMGWLARDEADGKLGPKTERALRRFHTGGWDMSTRTRGDDGLRAVQEALIEFSFLSPGSADGTWGPKTQAAVLAFQQHAAATLGQLPATASGRLDRATLLALDQLAP
jgi:beta-lactamase class A